MILLRLDLKFDHCVPITMSGLFLTQKRKERGCETADRRIRPGSCIAVYVSSNRPAAVVRPRQFIHPNPLLDMASFTGGYEFLCLAAHFHHDASNKRHCATCGTLFCLLSFFCARGGHFRGWELMSVFLLPPSTSVCQDSGQYWQGIWRVATGARKALARRCARLAR